METNVIIIGISLLILVTVLLILYLVYLFKYFKIKKEYYQYKREMLQKSNKMSMIEYYTREYKEHKNIYTLFRDLSNVLYVEDVESLK